MLKQTNSVSKNLSNQPNINSGLQNLIYPKPFVKWVGGKRQLIEVLEENMPKEFNSYFEPFVGGGALLFSLRPEHAFISDANQELINCYEVIRDSLDELISILKTHVNTEFDFLRIRAIDVNQLSRIECAARFIYLNKTCFNGLYRENKKGQFNASYGKYKNPKIVDEDNLLSVSDYLNKANVIIQHANFDVVRNEVCANDFIYFDPPYVPLTATANFTSYTAKGFTYDDQLELAQLCRNLDGEGVHFMVSNSNARLVHELYKGFNIQIIKATRNVSANAKSRAKQPNEVLITNY